MYVYIYIYTYIYIYIHTYVYIYIYITSIIIMNIMIIMIIISSSSYSSQMPRQKCGVTARGRIQPSRRGRRARPISLLSKFGDVVFEDVVFDNNRFYLSLLKLWVSECLTRA